MRNKLFIDDLFQKHLTSWINCEKLEGCKISSGSFQNFLGFVFFIDRRRAHACKIKQNIRQSGTLRSTQQCCCWRVQDDFKAQSLAPPVFVYWNKLDRKLRARFKITNLPPPSVSSIDSKTRGKMTAEDWMNVHSEGVSVIKNHLRCK